MTLASRLNPNRMEGSIGDSETLIGGSTSKKYRNKKICLKYLIFVAIGGFAIVGIQSVAQDLKSYVQKRESSKSLSIGGGGVSLEAKRPANVFDGHISKTSKLVGVTYSGEKAIRKLLKNVADVNTPYSKDDTLFSWEVAAFGDMAKAFCKCFQVNMATPFGMDEIGDSKVLQPIRFDGNQCNTYNVNLSTRNGISRAQKLGLVTNVSPDLISSPFLNEIVSLFTSERKGRIILAVPNVNVRLGMTYGNLSSRGLIRGSYLEFVSSNHPLANNYMTRMLSGKWGGQELTEEDLNVAAKIIKEKFIAAPWSGNRNIAKFVIESANWDANGFDCMYPPQNVYSKEAQTEAQAAPQPPPPPPPRSADDIAADTAVQLHNQLDNKLFDIIVDYANMKFSEAQ